MLNHASDCNSGALTVELGYDEQGNVAWRNEKDPEFDYGNRLREIRHHGTGAVIERYRYDAHGRRILANNVANGVVLSQYANDGRLMYQNSSRTGHAYTTDHIYLAGSLLAQRELDKATQAITVKYQHTDALGSPVAVTDVNGALVEQLDYEPYGKALGTPNSTGNNRPGYTGHVEDRQTGLTYMQQRYYDPELGVFLSVDQVGVDPITTERFNRYAYTENNPMAFIDPDGRAKKAVWLVERVEGGLRKIAQISQERAVQLRRKGGAELDIATNRRQVSSQIEDAANPGLARRDVAHELKDGSGKKGLPHYQTDGVRGHTFWGKLAVVAGVAAESLEQVAAAAEYIPEPVPVPGTEEDVVRWNTMMGEVSEATGLPTPGVGNQPGSGFQGYFKIEGRLDAERLNRAGK